MTRRTAALCLTAAATLLLSSTRAWAPYHLVAIEQVFFGTADCPNAQYVMLRTLAPGQVILGDRSFVTDNADGSDAGVFGTFTDTLNDGDTDVAILMGTPEAEALFGIPMDKLTDGHLVFPDGRVCWAEFDPPFDCVAYGAFTGSNPFGAPAVAPQLGMALVRQSATQDNATDFALGAPAPMNNAGQVGTLGQCAGAAASPTPTATAGAPSCVGDCNADSVVMVNELITGVNIVLGSSEVSTCPALMCGVTTDISCLIRAVNNLLTGCPATPTPTDTPPAATPTALPEGALGVRHFSIDPVTSRFIARLSPALSIPSSGLQGFLELTAGVPDPVSGVTFVDVTDASDYISVDVPSGGIAVCIHVLRDQLPVHHAGIVSCNGGLGLGLQVSEDHHLGAVGTCTGGPNAAASCSADAQCAESTCFDADACTAAGGRLEVAPQPHPGVCNGPLNGAPLADSGPGAVLISPDPINGFTVGLPVEIVMELHTPCGDENATGYTTMMALTSGHTIGSVLDYNNQAGAELSDEQTGVNFSCSAWSQENGPGTLVLSVPNLDLPVVQGQNSDIITSFILQD